MNMLESYQKQDISNIGMPLTYEVHVTGIPEVNMLLILHARAKYVLFE